MFINVKHCTMGFIKNHCDMKLIFTVHVDNNGDCPYPKPLYTGWSSVHWNATEMPLVDPVYTGIPLGDPANTCRVYWNTTGKLSWNCPHWNATGETLTIAACTGTPPGDCNSPHTPRYISISRVAPVPVWNDKRVGPQAASGQVAVNSAFTWSLLLCNGYQFCY